MKILLYTDVHLSQYSSILRKRSKKYSDRLENIINSVSWAENLAFENSCDRIICLGDFFDKPTLTDEELTALKDIEWSEDIPHTFIVGNHESSVNGLKYNSVKALEKPNFNVIYKPIVEEYDNIAFVFIPYILEEDRKPLKDYCISGKTNIVFSHNDIKGIRYGAFESKEGFDLDDIEKNCSLFLNGHLHNGNFLNDKETILNLGNLTGQNFSEDAFNYSHFACILDTETLQLDFFENPYAYNFYKLDINNVSDINILFNLKENSVLTIKCKEELLENLKSNIDRISTIKEYRILTTRDEVKELESGEPLTLNSVDYLQQFTQFILDKIGTYDTVKEELQHVCETGGTK